MRRRWRSRTVITGFNMKLQTAREALKNSAYSTKQWSTSGLQSLVCSLPCELCLKFTSLTIGR